MGKKQTALESLFDGSRTGRRNQVIYTPQYFIDRLLVLWPEGIGCDPCTGPESLVKAEVRFGPGTEQEDGIAPGLVWPERAFWNPPYDCLKQWLSHAALQEEQVGLIPVRSHRKWFQDYLVESVDAVCLLKSMTFVGYTQPFPAPLCAPYRGSRVEDFAKAFSGLGRVVRVEDLV